MNSKVKVDIWCIAFVATAVLWVVFAISYVVSLKRDTYKLEWTCGASSGVTVVQEDSEIVCLPR